MALLSEEDVVYLKKEFSEKLKENVKIIFFKSEDACMYCKETKDIITELLSLSDKISLIEYDFDKDKEAVKKYVVKRTPAIIIAGEDKDYGIRFYGIPAGHEFTTIITAIKNVSNKTGNLTENTLSKLKEITKPFNIQVFITPTWPHCPPAAVLAYSFAMANDNITAEVIETQEFTNLSEKYKVYGVPKTIMNDNGEVVGAVPESIFLNKAMESYNS